MADFLEVDDGKTWQTHADILNAVFHKKNKEGGDYELARRGSYDIRPGKKAVFFYLAERTPQGGWKQPHRKDWINIPDPDEKAFTQIAVTPQKQAQTPNGEQYAVFMRKKQNQTETPYRFYGIFERTFLDEDGITILFKRTSAALDYTQWQATE
jgi:hypothetical protein